MKSTVWFYRDYQNFSGGHLKLSHYLGHVAATQNWRPKIVFSDSSAVHEAIWNQGRQFRISNWQIGTRDIIFVAGADWQFFDQANVPTHTPVINLIQGVRHADPQLHLYQYLSRRSIRICVSEQVKQAIVATGVCNGPIFVIENGIMQTALAGKEISESTKGKHQSNNWLLLGIKNPTLAKAVANSLLERGINTDTVVTPIKQQLLFNKMEQAVAVVFFPCRTEGFYLPALEAMARSKPVICPDCVGNRSFCNNDSALIPEYSLEGYLACAEKLLNMPEIEIKHMLLQARKISANYTLSRERKQFYKILNNIWDLWNTT